MKLHTSNQKPDWEYSPEHEHTRWQMLAHFTHGIVTPGNILSVLGLILVIYGSFLLYYGDLLTALIVLIIGRSMDLVDGIAAEYTKTKSHLGEIIDTGCDKLGIIFVVTVAYSVGYLQPALVAVLLIHHIGMILYSLLYARRYQLHPVRAGKIAMFISWIAIFASLIANYANVTALTYLSWLLIVVYFGSSVYAFAEYYLELQRKIVSRMRAAAWTNDISSIINISNPKASSIKRSRKWLAKITGYFKIQENTIPIHDAPNELVDVINKKLQSPGNIIVTIAGGDGTVSTVAGIVLSTFDEKELDRIFLLPLWGGNANDFAYMLNGLPTDITLRRLLSQSNPVHIPTLEITFKSENSVKQIYACCYASFGASANAARELDKERIASKRMVRFFPLVILVRELAAVLKAFRDTTMFRAHMGKEETALYEHTFINGSRIAKVNRVPITLNEPAFFHAAVTRKNPSFLIEIFRIIAKRTKKQYVKKESVSFVVQDNINAQIDGEVYHLEKGTRITVSVGKKMLTCLSTKLSEMSD